MSYGAFIGLDNLYDSRLPWPVWRNQSIFEVGGFFKCTNYRTCLTHRKKKGYGEVEINFTAAWPKIYTPCNNGTSYKISIKDNGDIIKYRLTHPSSSPTLW